MSSGAARLDADVVVIGAGLSGLRAADLLVAAGKNPLVVEARERAGGRTLSRELRGESVDFGGEWIGRRHERVLRLVRRFGLSVERSGQIGRPVLWRLQNCERVGRLPPPGTRLDLARVLWKARSMSRRLDAGSAWRSPAAEQLDSVSVATWLDEMDVGEGARWILGTLIGALASAPTERVSLLQVLWWVRRARGPLSAIQTTFEWRIREGAQALAHGLTRELNGRLILGQKVTAIEQDGLVQVRTADGEEYRASRAIITASANVVPQIAFEPPLPSALRELRGLRIDPGTKVVAYLPERCRAPYATVLGRRKLWGAWRHGRRVTGFAPPPECHLPTSQLVGDLAAAFGTDARQLEGVAVQRWEEAAPIPGCDVAFGPSELTRYGPALRLPHHLVHFAGVERSSWPNNMEGALESGEFAAVAALTHR